MIVKGSWVTLKKVDLTFLFLCFTGLLQAMVPDTVAEGSSEQARMGIADWLNDGLDSKRASLERWLQSGEPQKLTPREQADLQQLFIGGGGSARL
eukprot:COSAG02_NODE_559_length_20335_cov_10.631894_20_plen_95_part_00